VRGLAVGSAVHTYIAGAGVLKDVIGCDAVVTGACGSAARSHQQFSRSEREPEEKNQNKSASEWAGVVQHGRIESGDVT
jgi:hypothetical protein